MRYLLAFLGMVAVLGCGSATDAGPTRYNFAVVAGANQSSTAGTPRLVSPITSQLTRDPQGTFASRALDRVGDFMLPALAYAQGINLAGDPVAGAIVCGRVAPIGEPQVVPLCAFTLSDGKAANTVEPGTKAGTFDVVFTAQDVGQQPIKDSTMVTVLPGPMASHRFTYGSGFICYTIFPADYVKDQYGNSVPYRMLTTGPAAHVVSDVMGSEGARTFVADADSNVPAGSPPGQGQPVTVEVSSGVIATATGEITQTSTNLKCVTIWFY